MTPGRSGIRPSADERPHDLGCESFAATPRRGWIQTEPPHARWKGLPNGPADPLHSVRGKDRIGDVRPNDCSPRDAPAKRHAAAAPTRPERGSIRRSTERTRMQGSGTDDRRSRISPHARPTAPASQPNRRPSCSPHKAWRPRWLKMPIRPRKRGWPVEAPRTCCCATPLCEGAASRWLLSRAIGCTAARYVAQMRLGDPAVRTGWCPIDCFQGCEVVAAGWIRILADESGSGPVPEDRRRSRCYSYTCPASFTTRSMIPDSSAGIRPLSRVRSAAIRYQLTPSLTLSMP